MAEQADLVALAENVLAAAKQHAAGEPTARQSLLNATQKLYTAAEPVAEFGTRFRFQPLQNMCLMLAQEMELLKEIDEKAPSTVTAKELAEKTGYDALLIVRVLRLLCTIGIVNEAGENTYQGSHVTAFMDTSGQRAGIQHVTELLGPIEATALKYLHETKFRMFPDNPGEVGPLEYAWGKPLFELFKTDAHHKENFDEYMATRRKGVTKQWFETYPAGEEMAKNAKNTPDDVLLIDVGGNTGYDVHQFYKAFPHLKGKMMVQDLEGTLKNAPDLEGVEKYPYDFFTPQPVKGAHAYFFRAVFHDWSDHKSRQILKNTVDAMDKDYSKVLIGEVVIPPVNTPLRSASLDALMMFFASGMERTPKQWEDLLSSVGLKIVKIWQPSDGMESVIEAVKA